ncbi:MAG: ABC transporter permease [Clostridiaceae bacterium]|jgi:hypothetical protein|nr:ABC transporter permease [Clostridiaceae bacterium]
MKEFGLLKLLDKFSRVFQRSGVDYRTLRLILQLKLTIDSRRVPTAFANNNKGNQDKNNFKRSLFLYTFMGLFSGIIIVTPLPIFIKLNLTTGIIIFLLMSTMISDFSTVLLDIKEKNILLPKPVDGKTLNTAKVIHIIYYLFYITLALAGPSLIIGSLMYGVAFFVTFLLELILICGFVVFFTSILYTFILAIFDGEKLKDIINYFQIVLSVAILIFYQLIGRVFNLSELVVVNTPAWWHYLMPTAWFAAPFSLILEQDTSAYIIGLSIAALAIPIVSLILYIKLVVPHFENNLQKLNNSAGKGQTDSFRKRLHSKTANLLCSSKQERLFYQFTQNIAGNERKLKLKLYPSLAFAAVMPFIFMLGAFNNGQTIAQTIQNISDGPYHFGLYFTVIMLGSTVQLLSTSENYRGAWIYRTLPLDSPVPIFKGALKSFIMKFIIPLYLFTSIMVILIAGSRVIPDIILIFANMMIVLLFIFKTSKRELPFYKDFQFTQDGSQAGRVFLSFFVTGALAGIHFLLSMLSFGLVANIAASTIISVLLWRSSFKLTWDKVSY